MTEPDYKQRLIPLWVCIFDELCNLINCVALLPFIVLEKGLVLILGVSVIHFEKVKINY